MSALPPKADIARRQLDVRFVPFPGSCTAANDSLFDHLVGARDKRLRHVEAERLGGFESVGGLICSLRAVEETQLTRKLSKKRVHQR
jgi:hypothetical protein